MSPSKPFHLTTAGLAVVAVCQLVLLGHVFGNDSEEAGRWLEVGADVSGIRVRGTGGEPVPLSMGGPRVVLVFHPECGHCAAVAPEWKSWLEEEGKGWDVLAVTSEPVETGRALAARNGWAVDVATVEADSRSDVGRSLTRRTPWVFVVDPGGVLVAEGHGSRLREVVAAAVQGLGGPPV